jgi:hypothetical protein
MYNLTLNFWMEKIKCYELRQVMRQSDEQFINILKWFQTDTQSQFDIDSINSLCFHTPHEDPKLPYLFYTNEDNLKCYSPLIAHHKKDLQIFIETQKICCNEKCQIVIFFVYNISWKHLSYIGFPSSMFIEWSLLIKYNVLVIFWGSKRFCNVSQQILRSVISMMYGMFILHKMIRIRNAL